MVDDLDDDHALRHLGLRRYCGLCAEALAVGEIFVALVSSAHTGAYDFFTRPAVFPDHLPPSYTGRLPPLINGYHPCRVSDCLSCAAAPEAVVLHRSCFQLFQRRCPVEDAPDRLWPLALSRSAWWGAPDLGLPETDVPVVPAGEAAALGIPWLRSLASEILQLICSFSGEHLFWRYCRVLGLAQDIAAAGPAPRDSFSAPLRELAPWDRGEQVVLAGPDAHAGQPVLRLTIDARGIKKLERLSEMPRQSNQRSDTQRFLIGNEENFKDVTARFERGFLRLCLSKKTKESPVYIWDSPTPPRLEDCMYISNYKNIRGQLHTIQLDESTTGLTFFMDHIGQICDIHAHTTSSPIAKTVTEERTSKGWLWVYLPLPPDERILSFGVQLRRVFQYLSIEGSRARLEYLSVNRPRLLFRTKLAGDVSLGRYYPESLSVLEDHRLSAMHPTLMIHNRVQTSHVSMYGTCLAGRDTLREPLGFRHHHPDDPPFDPAYLSTAPLEGVTHVSVFNSGDTGSCRGILLSYKNGAQRALGQCRLDVDPVESFAAPSHICFLRSRRTLPGSTTALRSIRVVASNTDHCHDRGDWVCWRMSHRTLEFWFDEEQSDLTSTGDE